MHTFWLVNIIWYAHWVLGRVLFLRRYWSFIKFLHTLDVKPVNVQKELLFSKRDSKYMK